jgi:F5/8 type C domain.
MKIATIAATVLLSLPILHAQDGEKAPIPLELPKPLFVGTPMEIKVPNLEPARDGERPDFLAPKGVVNLAAEKSVTSSDEYPVIGELEFITDGEKEGEEGYFVELGPGVQWIQVDLEKSLPLYAIVVWHFHSQARAYNDVIVQVSDDPEFKTGVTTLYNNDHDNSADLGEGKDPAYIDSFEGRIIDAKGTKARYVRCYSNGNTANDMNHYVEVEVWGLPEES